MSLPIFTAEAQGDYQWKRLAAIMIALIAIAGIAVVGGVVGYFFGQPKAFFLIVAVMVLWFIGGWLLGWRTEIGVLSALSAALAASDGTYPLTLCGRSTHLQRTRTEDSVFHLFRSTIKVRPIREDSQEILDEY